MWNGRAGNAEDGFYLHKARYKYLYLCRQCFDAAGYEKHI